MSKLKGFRTPILVVLAAVAILALFGLLINWKTGSSSYAAVLKHVDKQYTALDIPDDFSLTNVTKEGDPIDMPLNEAGYNYTYVLKNTPEQESAKFQSRLQAQGFTIDGSNTPPNFSAVSETKNLRLEIEFTAPAGATVQARVIDSGSNI